MVSRTDRSQFAEWWWTVDRFLLFGILALMVGGVVLSFAASPPVAERLHLDTYHFVKRQALFLVPAVAVLFGVSLLSPRQIRRVALVVLIGAVLMMLLTLFAGFEVKGARRWLSLFGMSIQPSEFVKPAFVVISAFLFAENSRRPEVPGNALAVLLLSIVLALLVAQPDFGQAVLISLVWCALFFMAGLPWLWIALLSVVGVLGALAAYSLLPHVALRIDRFLDPSSGDTFQVDTAIESFIRGGWLGRGPGEGTVKRILPDSHTDFTFAVAAEEFGIVLCMLLVVVFAFVVLRGFSHAMRKEDGFERLAAAGLVVLFGLQSIINMAVNVQLMPAKGMTLPFISYGGSSLLALALAMGFLLALTRRRPETMTRRPPVVFEPLARGG
ncbi:cell division protein FtsW [Rhodobium orientis]|uniref:Probable peptidoglycan glycosyltransferase FtsW n=1 Tax=Rhodobium orientis TaxID=34017 RepID=A0A327JFW5_9HYPH|nr:putative lipid II flippase FtsW [Rhodobium orientis]MBB4305462.1 cell division protein FtsW [Rhodobium orientis]MBK5948658.1 putative lipid II flippase FtsW [Rhodobium orientis]RAI25280.1 putative lipid II flippase FtsW [Rhodobium orientis]